MLGSFPAHYILAVWVAVVDAFGFLYRAFCLCHFKRALKNTEPGLAGLLSVFVHFIYPNDRRIALYVCLQVAIIECIAETLWRPFNNRFDVKESNDI